MTKNEKIYPTDAKTLLLLADDVRQEVDGKVTLMGYMPGDTLTLGPQPPTSAPQEALQSLAMIVVFQDGAGEFELLVSLIGPDGKDRFAGSVKQTVRKNTDGAMNVNLVMRPMFVHVGTYHLTVSLDDRTYKRSFLMKRSGT